MTASRLVPNASSFSCTLNGPWHTLLFSIFVAPSEIDFNAAPNNAESNSPNSGTGAASMTIELASAPVTGALANSIVIDAAPVPLLGEFDSALLGAALKSISLGATKMLNNKVCQGPLRVQLKDEAFGTRRDAVIEWQVSDSSGHDPFHSFAGSNEIRLSLAAKVIEAHGGSAQRQNGTLRVRLPLAP